MRYKRTQPAGPTAMAILLAFSLLGFIHPYHAVAQPLFEVLSSQPYLETSDSPNDVVAAQFLGDNRIDLAISTLHGEAIHLYENVNGEFVLAQTLVLSSDPRFMAVVDFNQDGLNDIVAASTWGNRIYLIMNNGGSFVHWGTYTTGDGPWNLTISDVDSDGYSDLVQAHAWDNYITIHYGFSGTGFGMQKDYAVDYGSATPACGDIDDDEDMEIVITHANINRLTVMESNGYRNFWVDETTPMDGEVLKGTALIDLNGDQFEDLAIAMKFEDAANDGVRIMLGDGAGGFSEYDTVPTGAYPIGLVARDFDMDLNMDLVAACYDGGGISSMLGGGNGEFTTSEFISLGAGCRDLAAFDLDGDGDLDLAVTARDEDRVYILRNTTDPTTPVDLTRFEATVAGESVHVNWWCDEASEASDFRLLRGSNGNTQAIPVTGLGLGVFTATDDDPRPGIDNIQTYTLYRKDDSDWRLLRSEDVFIPNPEPKSHRLAAQPNPFNPSTTLDVALPATGAFKLDIFDTGGRRVRRLSEGFGEGGNLRVTWDGRDDSGEALAGGVYLAQFVSKEFTETAKLVLLK